MSERGNTLLGVSLILLFLGSLIFYSSIFRAPKYSELLTSTPEKAQTFPLQKKFKLVSGQKASGDSVSLSELFKDRDYLIVNFWATWCPPCLDEIPSLEYLGKQLERPENKTLPRLVTISVDEDPKEVGKLFKTLDFSPTFTVLHDVEGEFATSLGTSKFPETFLINKSGAVVKKWVGPQNWLSGQVLKALVPNSAH